MFPKYIQSLLNKYLNAEYFKYANSTTWDVVTKLIKNIDSTSGKRLRAILCGQFGDYGLKPQDSSFLIQAGIVAHYMGGAYYPVGGSQRISKAIVPTIERAGGRVLVSCRAKSIIIEGGRATGVEVVQVDKSGQDKVRRNKDEIMKARLIELAKSPHICPPRCCTALFILTRRFAPRLAAGSAREN